MSFRKAEKTPHSLLVLEGDCHRPMAFSQLDLRSVHPYYQVEDLSHVDERLTGRGVRLRRLIDLVGPGYGTRWLTVESLDGDFSASLPLAEIARTAILVYEQNGKPLPREAGGPVRFIVPYHPDPCANVKAVGRLVISRKPGRDTRPSTKAEHERLHAAEPARG
jgi:2-dehydropantoate 2-reductase